MTLLTNTQSYLLLNAQDRIRAIEAGQTLKEELEQLLVGKEHRSLLGDPKAKSHVVSVEMPQFSPVFGFFSVWSCLMKEETSGASFRLSITSFIDSSSLYGMFRKAFNGLKVRLEIPFVDLGVYPPVQAYELSIPKFVTDGKKVVIGPDKPAFVRPVGADLECTSWVNAELRIDLADSNLNWHIICHVDALEFGQDRGRVKGNYHRFGDKKGLSFFLEINEGASKRKSYTPIARIEDVNTENGWVRLELARGVELFFPDQQTE